MSFINSVPNKVKDEGGAGATAQYLADWVLKGIRNGETTGGDSQLGKNVDELNRIVKNDPSLKPHLATAVQALMDYDGPADAAKPFSEAEAKDNPYAKAATDETQKRVDAGQDPETGVLKEDLSELKRLTNEDPSLKDHQSEPVRALLDASA